MGIKDGPMKKKYRAKVFQLDIFQMHEQDDRTKVQQLKKKYITLKYLHSARFPIRIFFFYIHSRTALNVTKVS